MALMAHEPLIALANSYDEVRYTSCFDLYPQRPDDVPPSKNSPEAPFAHYVFLPGDQPICYWSSELVFQGAVTALYRTQRATDGTQIYSVRWIGVLKFAAIIAVWLAFTACWWRRGAWGAVLANGALLPLLFCDPANTVYLNTLYAEWTALLALYTLCGLVVLCHDRPASRSAGALLALAAFGLATSKIQHLLLPSIFAAIVLALAFWQHRRWSWQGGAVLFGALAGLGLQAVQLHRDSDAIRAIDLFNRSDVTFTALLPNSRDPAVTARELGLEPDCLRLIGTRAWAMPDYPAQACPGLVNVTRARELGLLLHEPGIGLRLFWNGVLALDPWLAPGLGLVEGGDFEKLPDEFSSVSGALTAAPALRAVVLCGPLLALLALSWPRLGRVRPRLRLYTALTVATMLATLGITLLGDGLADTPKQAHLVFNAALGWWICVLALGVAAFVPAAAPLPQRN
jgi:hypothetical protein